MIIKNVIVYTEDKKFTAGGIVIHDDKIDNIYIQCNNPNYVKLLPFLSFILRFCLLILKNCNFLRST